MHGLTTIIFLANCLLLIFLATDVTEGKDRRKEFGEQRENLGD